MKLKKGTYKGFELSEMNSDTQLRYLAYSAYKLFNYLSIRERKRNILLKRILKHLRLNGFKAGMYNYTHIRIYNKELDIQYITDMNICISKRISKFYN